MERIGVIEVVGTGGSYRFDELGALKVMSAVSWGSFAMGRIGVIEVVGTGGSYRFDELGAHSG